MEIVAATHLVPEVDPNRELTDSFKKIVLEISGYLAKGGLKVVPFRTGTPFFRALPVEQKLQIVERAGFFRDLCAEHSEEGYEITDSPSFTWRALSKLGLTPSSDLFSHMTNQDIVEVYSEDNVQIFRNFRYFEFCSFSLEEVYSREWYHLYQRDQDLLPQIGVMIERLKSEEGRSGFVPGLPDHVVQEVDSDENLKMDYSLRWTAPLFAQKRFAGFILLEQARLHTNAVEGNC